VKAVEKNLSSFEKDVMDDYRKRDKRFSLKERKEVLCFSCLTKKILLNHEKLLASINKGLKNAN
jgi:hypothetical protein